MEQIDEDDDLKLFQASTGLLADLVQHLPKVLWKDGATGDQRPSRVHRNVRQPDLDRLLGLIEPFQSEPQLLDAKLKTILPPIVDAFTQHLSLSGDDHSDGCVGLPTAVCTILYTLCKVRGYKVIVGFFTNEPKYLEPILEHLENTTVHGEVKQVHWQVPYVLLLWLAHLLLTPFDLSSISTRSIPANSHKEYAHLPPLIFRLLRIGLVFLYTPTKAQDAAAAMLCRLCKRPDVQKSRLADVLTRDLLLNIQDVEKTSTRYAYELLGCLRFVAGISASAELAYLTPGIFHACIKAFDGDSTTAAASNAVAKKVAIKALRNIALLCLHPATAQGPLSDFLQTNSVLEDVIDFLLRTVGDKDTPVRYAAAKAISLIVVELDAGMGHDVIQAILETFKEDMPSSAQHVDFSSANALKWHGLALALAQALFKRSASPAQLPDILDALIMTLQFQQRTATGTVLGANVRDAANFGIWSLARRYATAELLSVRFNTLRSRRPGQSHDMTIPQVLAVELTLTACLDPAGNVRRGSSAALQELVGRHPDQVHEGIALVQTVEFLAVGLRNRAMIEVANVAASLHITYWSGLFHGLLGWRAIGSADALSRQNTAKAMAKLSVSRDAEHGLQVLDGVIAELHDCPTSNSEQLHGCLLAIACVLGEMCASPAFLNTVIFPRLQQLWSLLELQRDVLETFSPRMLRSELPASIARYLTSLFNVTSAIYSTISTEILSPELVSPHILSDGVDQLTAQLLTRHEEWILTTIPNLVQSLLRMKRLLVASPGCIGLGPLAHRVAADGTKSTLQGAGSAIALGRLLPLYDTASLDGEDTALGVTTLGRLISSKSVEWRVIGVRALQLTVESIARTDQVPFRIVEQICTAIHRGLNDYTIDERGDVGSLVRLQSISCTLSILKEDRFGKHVQPLQLLKADIYRLSLEKLDRVRLQASLCRQEHLQMNTNVIDVASISSPAFFGIALAPIAVGSSPAWVRTALLEGCMLCAGVGAESTLQAARYALVAHLQAISDEDLADLMSIYSSIVKSQLASPSASTNLHPALELLAFLFDMQIPRRFMYAPTFKWLNLLSLVQRSHHKSSDLPRLLAAVHVYRGLADVPVVRGAVLTKLVGMLKTNPYPRVRIAVAETLWMITEDDELRAWASTRKSGADTRHEGMFERLKGG